MKKQYKLLKKIRNYDIWIKTKYLTDTFYLNFSLFTVEDIIYNCECLHNISSINKANI